MSSVAVTSTLRLRLGWSLRWLEERVATRNGALAIFVLALCVYALESLAAPLAPGRDFGTYVLNYLQIGDSDPVEPTVMLGRTPLSPLLIGLPLDLAGGWLTEGMMAVLFAGSIVAWSRVALVFSSRAALLATVMLLAYPGYGILFHQLSSDPFSAAALAGWALLLARALQRPSAGRFALVGLGVVVLVGARQANQVLVVFGLLPLLVMGAPWRRRLTWAAAFAAAVALPLMAWSVNNGLRYGKFRVGNSASTLPLYRAFVTDRIVRPENGPASRELARGVQHYLLPKEPYRSYGITLDRYFTSGSPRMEADLYWVAKWTWGSQHNGKLSDVTLEAIRTHPWTYLKGVADTTWFQLGRARLFVSVPAERNTASATTSSQQATIVVNGRRLPKPTEGEPIPAANSGDKWTSPTAHHKVFDSKTDALRYAALQRDADRLTSRVHTHDRVAFLTSALNQASRFFPLPIMWLVLGLVAILIRRPRGLLLALSLAVAALLVILLAAIGIPPVAEYVVPVAPAFIILAVAGLVGERDRDRPRTIHVGR